MLTVFNSAQLNDKIITGAKVVNDLTLGGYLKLTDKIYSTDLTVTTPNSSLSLNNGVTLTSTSNISIGSSKPIYIASTGKIGIGTNSPNASYDVTILGNTYINGDMNISGTLNYTSTEVIPITDNTILLNSNWTAAATEDAGLEVERGTYANAKLFWNETNNRWEASYPVDNSTVPASYRIIDENYADTRYVNAGGDSMAGSITFPITISTASPGLIWSGLTDTHSIFVEEYGGAQSSRLVIRNQDDGDSDYTVFRSNATDILEVRTTYVQSNKNMIISDKKLTINTLMLSTQAESVLTASAALNLHVYLRDSLYIHPSTTTTASIRLYSANDVNYFDESNDGTTYTMNGSTSTHAFKFKNLLGDRLVIDKDGNTTATGYLKAASDLYLGTAHVGSVGNSLLTSNTTGSMLVADGWDWIRAGGIKANVTSQYLEIGTGTDFGLVGSASALSKGTKVLNNLTVGTSALFVDMASNEVGIGNITPIEKLDVTGSIRLTGLIRMPSGYLGFATDGGSALPIKVGSIAIADNYTAAAPTNGLYVQGRIGLGTQAPTNPISILKNLNTGIENWAINMQNDNAETNLPTIGMMFGVGDAWSQKAGIIFRRTGTYGTGDMFFLNNNVADPSFPTILDNTVMTLKSTGNVDIKSTLSVGGASSFGGTMTVTGNITVSGTVDGVDVLALKTAFDVTKGQWDTQTTNVLNKRGRLTKVLTFALVQSTAYRLNQIDVTWTNTWTSSNVIMVTAAGSPNYPGATLDYTLGTGADVNNATITFNYDVPADTILDIIIL